MWVGLGGWGGGALIHSEILFSSHNKILEDDETHEDTDNKKKIKQSRNFLFSSAGILIGKIFRLFVVAGRRCCVLLSPRNQTHLLGFQVLLPPLDATVLEPHFDLEHVNIKIIKNFVDFPSGWDVIYLRFRQPETSSQ